MMFVNGVPNRSGGLANLPICLNYQIAITKKCLIELTQKENYSNGVIMLFHCHIGRNTQHRSCNEFFILGKSGPHLSQIISNKP